MNRTQRLEAPLVEALLEQERQGSGRFPLSEAVQVEPLPTPLPIVEKPEAAQLERTIYG